MAFTLPFSDVLTIYLQVESLRKPSNAAATDKLRLQLSVSVFPSLFCCETCDQRAFLCCITENSRRRHFERKRFRLRLVSVI